MLDKWALVNQVQKALNKLKTSESQEIEQTYVPKLFENLNP